ncbi:hypothetical protein BHE74_00018561 [Ensete ventricosum]|nr:hypothetical protein GW17_00037701 [Ensete ventricosum]RWW73558.1 hypothetical protein BHE74_00018561 [Ensete ventricosum]RZR86923.1 hypothetical protein BHM03_00014215 [Ensete ventricosum]
MSLAALAALPLLPPTTANRFCCLSPSLLISLLPPPSISSSSSAGHTHRYYFLLPSRTPSYYSTHLSPLSYTSIVAPSHTLLCAAPALGHDLLCHNHQPPLPLHLHRR